MSPEMSPHGKASLVQMAATARLSRAVTERRAARWMLAALCMTVFAAGVGIVIIRRQDSATPVSVDDALHRYREAPTLAVPATSTAADGSGAVPTPETDGAPAVVDPSQPLPPGTSPADSAPPPEPGSSVPRPGVYTYATNGGEQVDVLGGAQHTYPAQTTITISSADCGVLSRWDALQERWDEQHSCATPSGETLRSTTQFHEFFGQGDRRDYQCDGGLVRPASDTPGTTWQMSCANAESSVAVSSEVVAIEALVVAGTPVETTHITATSTVTGNVRGTTVYELWLLRTTGLIVRRIVDVDTNADSPVGNAHYTEHYQIDLLSLEPRT